MSLELAARKELLHTHPHPSKQQWLAVTPQKTLDLLASFQYTIIRELLRRLHTLMDQHHAKSIIVAGGVACNSGLRDAARADGFACPVYFPTPGLSTDNAAMIAAAAFPKFHRREFAGLARVGTISSERRSRAIRRSMLVLASRADWVIQNAR